MSVKPPVPEVDKLLDDCVVQWKFGGPAKAKALITKLLVEAEHTGVIAAQNYYLKMGDQAEDTAKAEREKILMAYYATDQELSNLNQVAVRKCTRCGAPATEQTTKGKHNEEIGGLPQNDGYYCKKCADAGREEESEAMYG